MIMGRSKRALGVTLGLRKWDSHQGVLNMMERCYGHDHGGGVRECGKVRQLSGGLTVL